MEEVTSVMQRTRSSAGLSAVTEESRGQAIVRRRLALGIRSVREFEKAAGVSRPAITSAEEGHGSEATYQRLEAWLDRFEDDTEKQSPDNGDDMVELVFEDVFGVGRMIVRARAAYRDEVAEMAAKVMREFRAEAARREED